MLQTLRECLLQTYSFETYLEYEYKVHGEDYKERFDSDVLQHYPTLFSKYVRALELHRYEITISLNPKFAPSKSIGYDLIEEALNEIVKLSNKHCFNKNDRHHARWMFEYVVEHQKNGMPHLHLTLCLPRKLTTLNQNNWERKFVRMFGISTIYYTGMEDKIHKNDHFEGPWSLYLRKESNVYSYVATYTVYNMNIEVRMTPSSTRTESVVLQDEPIKFQIDKED
jgi:hypothetical protein